MTALRQPTVWVPLPVGFFRGRRPSMLAAEFGFVGPGAFVVILTETAAQGYHGAPKGTVTLGWADLARTLYIKPAEAQAIVDRIDALGLIDITERDDAGFRATLPAWEQWQPRGTRDPASAKRQRDKRQRDKGVTRRD